MDEYDKPTESDEKLVFEYPPDFFDDDIPKGVISPSQFNMYRRCAKQFYYRYILELIKPPAVAMIKGTAIHKGAEVVHKNTIKTGKPLSLEEATQAVVDTFDHQKETIEDWEDAEEGSVKQSAIANFRVYYKQAVPLIRPLAAEKTFALKLGGVPVRGVIDLIDQVPGEYELKDDPQKPPPLVEVVSDLKTTTRLWPPQKLNTEPQLTFYALAENTERVRVDFLLDQKSGSRYEAKRALRSVNEKKVLIEDLVEVVELIKKGIFPRCDPTSWGCTEKFCGYYQKCRGPR